MRASFVVLLLSLGFFAPRLEAEPAMWLIQDADSKIYLIGTVRVLRPELVWDSTKVLSAVGESTELWLEVVGDDDPARVAAVMQKHGTDPKKPLSKKLNTRQKAKLVSVTLQHGIPGVSLESLQPWAAAVMLSVVQVIKAGFDPNAGVEKILQTQAEKEGDKVLGLETIEEQAGFFSTLSQAEQIAFLELTLDQSAAGIESLDRLSKAWAEGDMETIGQVMVDEVKSKAPKLYDKLLVRRNKRWARQIAKILAGSGVHQIAVGAGHLAGPDSLQMQLEKRGIKVEPH
ncbi:MAG TPA: TraB/GumN family protein [Chthoniobacterales bacterium]|nr:TraB/GumN family protein [Chthoniobacterales bacterium]